VARPGLGTINHTLLTVNTLRDAAKVAGVVVNRYPAENPGVAEETNLRVVERWARVPLLCTLPNEPGVGPPLPANIVAVAGAVDWASLAGFS
jgi:dethiobiotin synthetase